MGDEALPHADADAAPPSPRGPAGGERRWRDTEHHPLTTLPRPRAMIALVLASASPRRADLLTRAGIVFVVRPTDTDESVLPAEDARRYVRRVARAKARAVVKHGGHYDAGAPALEAILAADTTVALAGRILGKPADPEEAAATLTLLSGRAHQVQTAVALRIGAHISSFTRTTVVHLRVLSPADIARYVATGEPMDKAGAYGIQGIGGSIVDRIVGSYTNVVGLPLPETLRLLARHGVLPADTGPACAPPIPTSSPKLR